MFYSLSHCISTAIDHKYQGWLSCFSLSAVASVFLHFSSCFWLNYNLSFVFLNNNMRASTCALNSFGVLKIIFWLDLLHFNDKLSLTIHIYRKRNRITLSRLKNLIIGSEIKNKFIPDEIVILSTWN